MNKVAATSTEQLIENSDVSLTDKFNKDDVSWILSLFGTAVGAGILFLPMSAGSGGFWPLILMTLLIGPMCYFSHRGLMLYVLSSSKKDADVIDVVQESFGVSKANMIALLHIFAFYPVLLIYGNSLTNTIESLLMNQLHFTSMVDGEQIPMVPRWLLSGVLISGMIFVMYSGKDMMLRLTKFFVYPLIVILFSLSIYLIPTWRIDAFSVQQMPSLSDLLMYTWLTIPVLIFAFNHSPSISSFAVAQRQRYGENAAFKGDRMVRVASSMLLVFIMFFVFSCVMSLAPEQLLEAKNANLTILSYLANVYDSQIINILGPMVAFVSIVSSFFGHYLGAREGIVGMVNRVGVNYLHVLTEKRIDLFVAWFVGITVWLVTQFNPSVIDLITKLGSPVMVALLYFMPMYALYKAPAMKKYRKQWSNKFVILMGVLGMTSIIYGMFVG
jgi:serine transporter